MVRYVVKPSSVTKRHIMDGIGKAYSIVFTPHQSQHSAGLELGIWLKQGKEKNLLARILKKL